MLGRHFCFRDITMIGTTTVAHAKEGIQGHYEPAAVPSFGMFRFPSPFKPGAGFSREDEWGMVLVMMGGRVLRLSGG